MKIREKNRQRVFALVWTGLFIALLILGGCGKRSVSVPSADSPAQTVSSSRSGAVLLLEDQLSRWAGVRYMAGGNSRKGVDCSAFTRITYDELFGIVLPRTTDEQAEVGRAVTRSRMLPGDLVFFKTGFADTHVGIYLGANDFIHASSSRGVTRSSLAEGYWQKKYWQARRVF